MKAIIVAIDENNGFAREGAIPWYYPEDFKHFKAITTGNVCVMGRNTYLEIDQKLKSPPVQVLPNRTCYVLSKTLSGNKYRNITIIPSYQLSDLDFFLFPEDNVFFIGGKEIFDLALPIVDEIYITHIHNPYGCDQFFDMEYVKNNFRIADSLEGVERDLTFVKYIRDK